MNNNKYGEHFSLRLTFAALRWFTLLLYSLVRAFQPALLNLIRSDLHLVNADWSVKELILEIS